MRVPETEHAWAAGFIDGEGYLALVKVHGRRSDGYQNRKPRIEVCQSELRSLQRLRRLYDGYILRLVQRPNRKPVWRWEVTNTAQVRNTILQVMPYMTVKRRQAALLLKFICLMQPRSGGRRIEGAERRRREALHRKLCVERAR